MSKPDLTILAKPKGQGKTIELGACWLSTNEDGSPRVFTNEYGSRQSYNFRTNKKIKSLTISGETVDGKQFSFTPGEDAYINLMMDLGGGEDNF